ncbi:uncharacterized protein LOC132715740 [Ruditapes philippinarum]|uniref:uncharacterized protein LOC132715740 n=1 Tax=Ruditapes philippinarum TaxID=129788 RepID=UPI00295BF282|nr:uncharacterized protein LOC132715740 [Ruditapes philippinarum]
MAGKEDTTPGITGSEEIINCTTCSEAERTTVAIKYCVDCTTYVCQDCLNDHNKFAALRKHQIVEITEANELLGDTDQVQGKRSVECRSHDGHFVDRYCKDHDEVCCSLCVTVKHRSCKDINKIETVAEGIKESQEFCELKSSLEKFIMSANQEKAYRNYYLKDMTEEKEKKLTDIDKYEERLIQRIKVLANTSRENIQEANANHQDAVKADIKELDSVMSEVTKRLNHFNRAGFNGVEAFITIKNCQIFSKEAQKVKTDLSNKWLQTSLLYTFIDDDVLPKEITAFLEVAVETKACPVFHLQVKQSVDITCQTDSNKCSINGICQLPDNTVLITDAYNGKLKRLGDNLEVKDYIDLNDTPECMCVTQSCEVAIVLRERNLVQFVTIDENMTLETSFPITEGKCTSIDSDPTDNKLYVCCMVECKRPIYNTTYGYYSHKYHVIVYNKKGECLSIFNNEEDTSQNIFEPLKILISVDTFDLIDADASIYEFSKTDMKGKPSYKYYVYNRAMYKYLCMLSAEKIMFVNKNGEMFLKIVHGRQDQRLRIEDPLPVQAVLFNKQKSTLIVVGESSQIKEYKMDSKILYLFKE